MSARDLILSVLNASLRPLRRTEVMDIVREEYDHECHPGTVDKWLQQLARQGRVQKLGRGLYASNEAAVRWRKENEEEIMVNIQDPVANWDHLSEKDQSMWAARAVQSQQGDLSEVMNAFEKPWHYKDEVKAYWEELQEEVRKLK